jgi:hypothetical protein
MRAISLFHEALVAMSLVRSIPVGSVRTGKILSAPRHGRRVDRFILYCLVSGKRNSFSVALLE